MSQRVLIIIYGEGIEAMRISVNTTWFKLHIRYIEVSRYAALPTCVVVFDGAQPFIVWE